MKKGSNADLEYFDNPEYRDRMQNASRDAMALTQIIWNGNSMASLLVSLVSASLKLCVVRIVTCTYLINAENENDFRNYVTKQR